MEEGESLGLEKWGDGRGERLEIGVMGEG